ncbi:STAS domain-containing protein [Rhodocytophaga rosea]|uniref:Anti-sigma factor antagonist n=1 Tax=Rhodocytophaga rosea TaxID=2704465 RepID=A0A6C0GDV3_9BACT|nr:STAS domain-containing protein [Rhodocytophaga rosea]QHT66004.1 STAS domain-containing protein [Rhodocytophaga rosea]
MTYTTQISDQIVRITLTGDMTGFEDSQSLLKAVDSIIKQGILLCVADISQIRYMNSSGINTLTTLLTKFRTRGGEMVLTKPSEQVQKLLIITKLNAIFTIVEDHAAAVVKLKSE